MSDLLESDRKSLEPLPDVYTPFKEKNKKAVLNWDEKSRSLC